MGYPFEYGHVQRATWLAGCMIIVMTQINLSPEMQGVYNTLKAVSIVGVILMASAHLLTSYYASELAASTQLQEVSKDLLESVERKTKEAEKATVTISTLPTWEDDGSHPSHVLTTVANRPKIFPFPLGKASTKGSDLYFESGLPPTIGDFSKGRGETYQSRLKAAQAAQKDAEKLKQARTEAIRKFEYQERRKQWRRRMGHVKALCIVLILSYLHTKLALIGLAILAWRTLSAELERLQQSPPGAGVNDKFAARWGTETRGRKRPYGMAGGSESQIPNNIGMTYLYRPDSLETKGLSALAEVPLRGPIRPLLETTDHRLAGGGSMVGETERYMEQTVLKGSLGATGKALGGKGDFGPSSAGSSPA